MKVQPLSLRVIVLILLLALLGGVIGCGRADPEPVAAEPIEESGVEVSALASPAPIGALQPMPTYTFTPVPSPTPTATVTPSPTPRPGLPVQLRIPAIGVDAFIEHVGLTEDLAMDVPSTWENVAWYQLGYRPGERGSAVIAGHLDTVTGAPAVFWALESLEPGDEIFVRGLDGVEHRFIVDFHTRYPYDDAPVQEIFGPAEVPRLALITCNGEWDRVNRNYSQRVVLYAMAAQDDEN